METVTHENSVVIDRTTAASTELRHQEKTLAAAVSAFHLSDPGGSAASEYAAIDPARNREALQSKRASKLELNVKT